MSIDWVEASKILLTALSSAIFIGVFAFAAQKLIDRWFLRNLAKFNLDLQMSSFEYQARFSKLHEKRADVIDELYKRIDRMLSTFGSALRPLKFNFEASEEEQLGKGFEYVFKFIDYYFQNRLYLDKHLCEKIEELVKKLNEAFAHYSTAMSLNQFLVSQDPTIAQQRAKYLNEMADILNNDLPPVRSDIEEKMQRMLGMRSESNLD